jgi:hypothetical protein
MASPKLMASPLHWAVCGISQRSPMRSTLCTSHCLPPPSGTWISTSTISCMTLDSRNRFFSQPPPPPHTHTHTQSNPSSIVVGNKSLLHVTSTSHTPFSVIYHQLHLRNVLFYPNIIKILFLFASLPLIIKFLLNLIPLVFL